MGPGGREVETFLGLFNFANFQLHPSGLSPQDSQQLGKKKAFRDSTSKVNQNEYSPLPDHPPSTQNLQLKEKGSTHKEEETHGGCREFHPAALEQQETFRNLCLLTA